MSECANPFTGTVSHLVAPPPPAGPVATPTRPTPELPPLPLPGANLASTLREAVCRRRFAPVAQSARHSRRVPRVYGGSSQITPTGSLKKILTFPDTPNRHRNTKGKMHPDAHPSQTNAGGDFFIFPYHRNQAKKSTQRLKAGATLQSVRCKRYHSLHQNARKPTQTKTQIRRSLTGPICQLRLPRLH